MGEKSDEIYSQKKKKIRQVSYVWFRSHFKNCASVIPRFEQLIKSVALYTLKTGLNNLKSGSE